MGIKARIACRLQDNLKGPEENKEHIAAEFHAFSNGAADEGRSDDCEHALEHDEGISRYGAGEGFGGGAHEEDLAEIADDCVTWSKSQGIAEGDPLNTNDSEGRKGMHDRIENVLFLHHPSIEERKTRKHEHH